LNQDNARPLHQRCFRMIIGEASMLSLTGIGVGVAGVLEERARACNLLYQVGPTTRCRSWQPPPLFRCAAAACVPARRHRHDPATALKRIEEHHSASIRCRSWSSSCRHGAPPEGRSASTRATGQVRLDWSAALECAPSIAGQKLWRK
jgi:hypothetical protein